MQKQNEIFNYESFKKLATVHDTLCLSVYMPTYRAGQEINEGLPERNLKNIIKGVRKEFEERNISKNDTDDFLRPLYNLLEDRKFWTDQSDGLAIFLNNDTFEMFKVPIHFEPWFYIAPHYYLKPLIPLLNKDNQFYILAFSLNMVKLYECTPYTITEIDNSEFPQQLEDVVGYDKVPDSLQQRGNQDDRGRPVYHGHGSEKDVKNIEATKYIKAIDHKLNEILSGESVPLVLACDDQHFGTYRKISKYKNLVNTNLSGNFEEADPVDLHAAAKEFLQTNFEKELKEKKKAFLDMSATGKTMWDLEDIVPAAVNGRIDTLFLNREEETYGLYDKETNSVNIDNEKLHHNASLYNLIAVSTIRNQGNVYLLEKDEMPLSDTNVNALLRY
ncbi:MAG: hypothetical protein ACQES1_03870 [Bacteroidota bacterium]